MEDLFMQKNITPDNETLQNAEMSLSVSANTTELTGEDVILTVESSADIVRIEYSENGKDWNIYPVSGVVVQDNKTIFFRGFNTNGATTETFEYTVDNIDNIPPEKPQTFADVTIPTNGKVTVTASFSTDSVLFEYNKNDLGWDVYTGEGIAFEENGTVKFRSYDAVGNVSDIAEYKIENIDRVQPEKPQAIADSTTPTNGKVTVTAGFSIDSVRFEYNKDNQGWVSYTSEGVTFDENGTVEFRSFDIAGNVSEITAYKVENIDKIPPEAPSAVANMVYPTNGKVTVISTFSSDSVICQYNKNDQGWEDYPDGGIIFEDNGTVQFRSFDAAGNMSSTTEYKVENIDKVPPSTPTPAADITNPTNGKVTVTCQFSTDSVRCEYSTDGQSWVDYPAEGVVFEDNGSVYFRSFDIAGNVSETKEYKVENIDKIPPESPMITVSREYNTSHEPVTFIAAAKEGFIEYSFDSDSWFEYTEPVMVTENKTVYVRTTDAAGNSSIAQKVISNIDPVAESSIAEYIFIKNKYTADNTQGKKVNGIELNYEKNAFSSLEDAKDKLADHGNEKYVFVMLDSKTVLSGLLENFTGKTISGNQQKVKLESDEDFHNCNISITGKNTIDIVSGDFSTTTVEWFNRVNLSGRSQVAEVTGGSYQFAQKTTFAVNKQGTETTTERFSRKTTSGGKLTGDSFANAGKIEFFKTVVLDNAQADQLIGGKTLEKRNAKYIKKADSLQKNISESGSWTAGGTLTLKNVADVQNISGYKKLNITNATAGEIYGGNGKYSYKEKSTYTTEKITASVSFSNTFSSTASINARGSIFQDIYGVSGIKLTDSRVAGNIKNSALESLNGTFTEKFTASTAKNGTVTGKYEKRSSYKRNGSFTATAKNDKMITGDIMYYNKVVLDRAETGTIINQRQTKAVEIYQQIWTNAAAYGSVEDLSTNFNIAQADLLKAEYVYSASGSVSLKNEAVVQSVLDYKTVTLKDSMVIGNIELGDCITVKYNAKIDSADSGMINKTEETVTTYKRSGSVKLTNSVAGGNITGYNKVVLSNSTAGNISQKTITKSVDKKANGLDDVNNSYITEKLSGAVTLEKNSRAGDITNYSSVTLNDSSAGNLSNVGTVKVGKGHGEIVSFTGTSGNDSLTISKGAVFSVTGALDFGSGNKDTLTVNGTLVLYTADVFNVEKITGSGDIAVTDEVANSLQLNFENLLNLGATVENFQGSLTEMSDNTAKKALFWDGAEELNGWLGKDVDCEDTIDFITFHTNEDCILNISSDAWLEASADIAAVNNVILNIIDGSATIALAADTDYTIKIERKESGSAAYTVTLA